jgi:adenosylcobinamide kinase/adenosylcobinamide-phosphate guanylyltransferase
MAERLAHDSGLPVTYVATARPGDEEMRRRIAQHRVRRPAGWRLIEEPLELAEVLSGSAAAERCLLVECLTLWLTNLLLESEGMAPVESRLDDLATTVGRSPGRIVLVGNETNMGVVPLGELSRRYCDLAGRLHQDLAQVCDQVLLMVAGLPLALKGPAP